MGLPSRLYDREYFLSDRCEGFECFRGGRGLSPLKRREIELLELEPGARVLDAGCGRGEMLLECARRGARVAGIDYSRAAVELSAETLAEVPGAEVLRGEVSELPWPDQSFDRALLGDVIEHLDPDQADSALRELRRVLRPGGLLLVHTAPNRLFLRYGWPAARTALRLAGHGEPASRIDAWIAESQRYHVNEQSLGELRRSLRRAGFSRVRAWIDADLLRDGDHHLTREVAGSTALAAGSRLLGLRPLRAVFGNDLYAIGSR